MTAPTSAIFFQKSDVVQEEFKLIQLVTARELEVENLQKNLIGSVNEGRKKLDNDMIIKTFQSFNKVRQLTIELLKGISIWQESFTKQIRPRLLDCDYIIDRICIHINFINTSSLKKIFNFRFLKGNALLLPYPTPNVLDPIHVSDELAIEIRKFAQPNEDSIIDTYQILINCLPEEFYLTKVSSLKAWLIDSWIPRVWMSQHIKLFQQSLPKVKPQSNANIVAQTNINNNNNNNNNNNISKQVNNNIQLSRKASSGGMIRSRGITAAIIKPSLKSITNSKEKSNSSEKDTSMIEDSTVIKSNEQEIANTSTSTINSPDTKNNMNEDINIIPLTTTTTTTNSEVVNRDIISNELTWIQLQELELKRLDRYFNKLEVTIMPKNNDINFKQEKITFKHNNVINNIDTDDLNDALSGSIIKSQNNNASNGGEMDSYHSDNNDNNIIKLTKDVHHTNDSFVLLNNEIIHNKIDKKQLNMNNKKQLSPIQNKLSIKKNEKRLVNRRMSDLTMNSSINIPITSNNNISTNTNIKQSSNINTRRLSELTVTFSINNIDNSHDDHSLGSNTSMNSDSTMNSITKEKKLIPSKIDNSLNNNNDINKSKYRKVTKSGPKPPPSESLTLSTRDMRIWFAKDKNNSYHMTSNSSATHTSNSNSSR